MANKGSLDLRAAFVGALGFAIFAWLGAVPAPGAVPDPWAVTALVTVTTGNYLVPPLLIVGPRKVTYLEVPFVPPPFFPTGSGGRG